MTVLFLPTAALVAPTLGNLLAWDGTKYEPSTGLSWASSVLTVAGNISQTGATTFSTGTGAVSLNGFTTIETIATVLYTGASGASGGSALVVKSNDGAAMASGDRLGQLVFAGAKDASNSNVNAASIDSFCTEAWGASAAGTELRILTCPNGSTTRATAATFGQDKSFTIASGGAFQVGNAYVATPQVPSGYIIIKDSTGTDYKVSVTA